jgi:hypothetical protein
LRLKNITKEKLTPLRFPIKNSQFTTQKSPSVSPSFFQASSALPDNTPDSDVYPGIPIKDKRADFYFLTKPTPIHEFLNFHSANIQNPDSGNEFSPSSSLPQNL